MGRGIHRNTTCKWEHGLTFSRQWEGRRRLFVVTLNQGSRFSEFLSEANIYPVHICDVMTFHGQVRLLWALNTVHKQPHIQAIQPSDEWTPSPNFLPNYFWKHVEELSNMGNDSSQCFPKGLSHHAQTVTWKNSHISAVLLTHTDNRLINS